MPSIETAAARFVDDMKSIKRDYDEEAREHNEALRAIEEECEERLRIARKAHREKALEINAKYRERVAQAAKIRASKASDEAAGDINEAAAHMGALIGGACHDTFTFNSDVARACVENGAKRREDAETLKRETGRRSGIILL